jgi:hypothetical protein
MRTALLLILAALVATTRAYREEGGVSIDPVGEATADFELLSRDFRPGMDTAELNELTWQISQRAWGLAINRNYLVVGSYTEWLSDTVQLPDEARQYMLRTLGVLGDTTAAKIVMKYATDTVSEPSVRYEAAIAICLLGNAEVGTRVLEDMALAGTVRYDHLPTWQFLGSGSAPVKLKRAADEKALTSYFRWLAGHAESAETQTYAVCYLLQRDKDSRNLAYRVAERALKTPGVYLPDRNDKRALLGVLGGFGGKRGKALAAKYE